jgi:heat shock protein HtpX
MVLVAVLNPLIALGLLAAVIVFLPNRWLLGLAVALGVGMLVRVARFCRRALPPGRTLSESDDPALFGALDRLCALADISRPQVVLSDQAQPNTWVVHVPGRQPRLYVTRGLREALTPEEFQAVLGHELAHIANRDALVMTIVGWPAAVMLRASGGGGPDALIVIGIGVLSHLGLTVLSRYRELAADAGACAITGRPSALSSALLKVSRSLTETQIPRRDLRAAAALNAFNLVEVPPPSWLRDIPLLARMVSTHPPLRVRLDALEAVERAQQRPGISRQ